MKGDSIGESPFFNKLVFVKSGFLAQAVLNPGSNMPFMLTLSGGGSFANSSRVLMSLDNLPRRYWAVTKCEVLTVIPEILLRLAEVEKSWSQELENYCLKRAVCERLGLMVCQAASLDQRFGVFLVSALFSVDSFAKRKVQSNSVWIEMPSLPSRKLICTILACNQSSLDDVIRQWIADGTFKHVDGKIYIKRQKLLESWEWMQPFVRMQDQLQESVRPRNGVELSFY